MNRLQANLCLLCVTLCWSTETILYSHIPSEVPSIATTCVTCLIGAFLLFAAFYRRAMESVRSPERIKLLLSCLVLAILNASYNTLFLYGAKSFDVASGAFTFCMTVVVLPVVLLTMRRSISPSTWISVALVCSGIVMALGPTLRGEQVTGLALMAIGCLLRAVFIVLLADIAKKFDPVSITIFFQLFAGLFSLIGWFCVEPRLFLALSISRSLIASWAIYAYFIVAFAQSLNIFAMKRVTATNATVVYSLEIVFSIIWSTILPEGIVENVKLTPFMFVGMMLVVIGSLAEIIDFRKARAMHESKIMEGKK